MSLLSSLVQFTCLVGASAGCMTLHAAGYTDPRNRFALQTPAGWTATPLNNDAVQFASGNCYLTVMAFQGADPQTMVQAIARQTGGQWRNFTEVRRGPVTLGGRPGVGLTCRGVNPRGQEAEMQLAAAADGPNTVLLMASAALADLPQRARELEQIRAGFRFPGGAPAAATVPPPAPATVPPPVPATAYAGTAAPPPPPAQARAAVPAGPAAGAGYYRMRRHVITDQHGFERPLPAMSLLLPVDWQLQGEVQYVPNLGCHQDMVQLVFQARSGDGRLRLELFPNHHWQWMADPGMVQMLRANAQKMAAFGRRECDVSPPMAAADYLRQVVIPQARPGAQVLGSEPMPELGRGLEDQIRQYQQVAAQQGMRMQVRTQVDTARVHLATSGQGGETEEWLAGVTLTVATPAPSYNMRTGQMGQTLNYQCSASLVFGMAAPRGELAAHERLFDMILGTVQVDPEWEGRVLQVMRNMAASDSKSAMDRSAIASQYARDSSRIINQGYQERSQRMDRTFANFDNYIRGVENYRNPATGEVVQLSNQYGHAWSNGNGEYVLSDQAGFNPNSALRGSWTELQPVH
jgi:hypothetical protein